MYFNLNLYLAVCSLYAACMKPSFLYFSARSTARQFTASYFLHWVCIVHALSSQLLHFLHSLSMLLGQARVKCSHVSVSLRTFTYLIDIHSSNDHSSEKQIGCWRGGSNCMTKKNYIDVFAALRRILIAGK